MYGFVAGAPCVLACRTFGCLLCVCVASRFVVVLLLKEFYEQQSAGTLLGAWQSIESGSLVDGQKLCSARGISGESSSLAFF